MKHRRIMHIDMDAFFASVEIARNPKLKGLPVAVGGPGSRRGVVAAASYEVRKYGVHSAMPIFRARELCPKIILIKPDFHAYAQVSRQVIRILQSFTPDIEPLSIDESFVGLTGIAHLWGSETELAQKIKEKIARHCNGVTCSIGIGPSRVTAKTASDFQKPNGLTIVDDAQSFLRELPLQTLPGIGRKTVVHLQRRGFTTVAQLQATSEGTLQACFGKAQGSFLFHAVRGTDSSRIHTTYEPPKSISRTETLLENTTDIRRMFATLGQMCDETTSELAWHGLFAKTVHIVIRYGNFHTVMRHRTLPESSRSPREILPHIKMLWRETLIPARPVRLVGMGLSNFTPQPSHTTLFNFRKKEKEERLMSSITAVRKYYGKKSIWWGAEELT